MKGETELLGGGDLKAIPLERLEHEITELAAHIYAATCRWLCLVAEFDRREGPRTWGFRSCADWLSWRCSVAPASAREQVRVARRLRELPLIRESFARGELSYSKVRALTRVAHSSNEEEVVMLARHATAAQLERLLRAYRGVVATELTAANRAHSERYLLWSYDDDGSLVIRGRLSAEEGEAFLAALGAALDQLPEPDVSAETPDTRDEVVTGTDVSAETRACGASGSRNADALGLMAESLLATGAARLSGGERHQVVVHVDAAALRDDAHDGRCQLDGGAALPPETARRLACDASLVQILERDGKPLSVGRKTRAIPPALRRALRSRDGCCRFPGCTQSRFVDAHHIEHWSRGGPTSLENLIHLCRHHHRLVHEGGYAVERRRGGRVIFRRPGGRRIPDAPELLAGDPSRLIERTRRWAPDIDHESCVPQSGGDRLDYGIAVEGLLERDPPLSESVA